MAEPAMDMEDIAAFIGSPNIAPQLDKRKLGDIASRVLYEYGLDLSSRSEWEDKMKNARKLAMQVSEPKSYPWPKASSVKYPLMTTAAIQFAARAYPAIVSGRNVVKGKVIGDDRGIPAIDQQTGQQAIDPNTGQPAWLMPPGEKRSKATRISQHMSWQLLDEMEEWEEDTDTLLHILPIMGAVFRKTYHSPIEKRNVSELVLPHDLVVNYHAKWGRCPRVTHRVWLYPHEIRERMLSGVFVEEEIGPANESGGDEDAPHEFLEQHRWLDLDGDDYPEPYIVTVHKDTGKLVRVIARFDEDGIRKDRYGNLSRIVPVEYFTRYLFMPAIDGNVYGMGFGLLLNDINNAVNTTINQLIDAGHLANTGGGFIGNGIRLRAGETRFKPGEFKPVAASGGTIRDNIVQLQFAEPSSVLFNLLGLLIEAGKEISAVKDILTGDAPRNAPATTTLALIEQGMKVFTAIYKRVHRSLKQELDKLFRLNRLYLPPEVYFEVLDNPAVARKTDYQDNAVDVVPVSDPTVVTDMQKMGRAQFLMEWSQTSPMANRGEVDQRLLEAAGIDDVQKLILQETPPDPKMVEAQRKAAESAARLDNDRLRAQSEAKKNLAEGARALSQADAEEAKAITDRMMAELKGLQIQIEARKQDNE